MTVLVTGAGGMIGSHMMEMLHDQSIDAVGTFYKPTTDIHELPADIRLIECDVRYPHSVDAIVAKYKPDTIYHLAAQSYPTVSWDRPYETMDTNVNGTIAICEAVKRQRSLDATYDPAVVIACSSAEYGQTLDDLGGAPVTEDAPLAPLHPYGVSKVAQDLLGYQYFKSDGIRILRARIFNTTGTRKVNDVTSDFTLRAIEQERAGAKHPVLRVGNIETRRAILDCRDLVGALFLLAEKGTAGEAYNISATEAYSIRSLIESIEKLTGLTFELDIDPALLRPTDEKVIIGDTTKLALDTGWAQSIPYEQTVADMLDYWRWKLA